MITFTALKYCWLSYLPMLCLDFHLLRICLSVAAILPFCGFLEENKNQIPYHCIWEDVSDKQDFSKSQSRDSQKSNPGIFWDFQKPLNDYILRLSIPFIDHNNLFWDLWSLQEHIEHIAVLYFLVIWTWESSTGWWLHIWGCRLLTVLWGPKLTKWSEVFGKSHLPL